MSQLKNVRRILGVATLKRSVKLAVLEEARSVLTGLGDMTPRDMFNSASSAASKGLDSLSGTTPNQLIDSISKKLQTPSSRYNTGAALGAGAGAIGSLLMERTRPKEDRRTIRAILTGAIGGGAIGGGGLWAADKLAPPAMVAMNSVIERFKKPSGDKPKGDTKLKSEVKEAALAGLKNQAEQLFSKAVSGAGDLSDKVVKGLNDPATRTMYAAGAGAVGGGLAGLVAEAASNRKRKRYLGSVATGAAGGALLGGAGVYAADQFGLTAASTPKPVAAPDPAYNAFVSALPTDPTERAAALKEYLNKPDTRSYAQQAFEAAAGTAADYPLAAGIGAAGIGGAVGLKGVDTAKNWARTPEGARDSIFSRLGQSGHGHKLTSSELAKALHGELGGLGFDEKTLRELAERPSFRQVLQKGLVDKPEFMSQLEGAWRTANPVTVKPGITNSHWETAIDAALRKARAKAGGGKNLDLTKVQAETLKSLTAMGFDANTVTSALKDPRMREELSNVLQNGTARGRNIAGVFDDIWNTTQPAPRAMPNVSTQSRGDAFQAVQQAGKAKGSPGSARKLLKGGLGATTAAAVLQYLLSGGGSDAN